MSTPVSRVSRLLNEGARFMVELPGQAAIDLTPDVMAALNELQRQSRSVSTPAQLTPTRERGTDTKQGKGG